MKVLIPTHFNAGNRGCEAIARGTEAILDEQYDIIGYSSDLKLDNKVCNVKFQLKKECSSNFIRKVMFKIGRRLTRSPRKKG